MSTPEGNEAAKQGFWSTLIVEMRDITIILAALATLAVVTVFITQHYETAKDAGVILGIVVPVISTIAGTAFGVSVGVQAGARTAEATRKESQAQSQQIAARADALEKKLDPVLAAASNSKAAATQQQVVDAKAELEALKQTAA